MARIRDYPDDASLMEALLGENSLGSMKNRDRYPVRFVILPCWKAWNTVVYRLRNLNIRHIRLSTLASAPDLLPVLSRLEEYFPPPLIEHGLITPIREVFRFMPQEQIAAILGKLALYEYPSLESCTGYTSGRTNIKHRLYVPIFCSKEWFEHHMKDIGRYIQGELPTVFHLSTESEVGIYIAESFPDDIPSSFCNLEKYFEMWELGNVSPPPYYIQTSFAVRAPRLESRSTIIFRNTEEYIRAKFQIPAEVACELQDSFWKQTLKLIRFKDETIFDCVNRKYGWNNFKPEMAFSLISSGDAYSANLLWIALSCWSKHAQGYLATVCCNVKRLKELVSAVYSFALKGEFNDKSLKERRDLLCTLSKPTPPADFLEEVRHTAPADRLRILTPASFQEQCLVVESAQELLLQGVPPGKVSNLVAQSYPALAWYLAPYKSEDSDLAGYFSAYTSARIQNTLTSDLEDIAEHIWCNRQDLAYKFKLRQNHLKAFTREGIFWADGLGIEWAEVIRHQAESVGLSLNIQPAQANLPTDTANNKCWDDKDLSNPILDKIGHAADYRFPNSFVLQLNAICSLVIDISTKLKRNEFSSGVAVLTGDHGLTPRIFHRRKYPVPSGFETLNGRSLQRTIPEAKFPTGTTVEKEFCYIQRHGLFEKGQTKGMIHGGATLEEWLVPIAEFKLQEVIKQPVQLVSMPQDLTLGASGAGQLVLELSENVPSVTLQLADKAFTPEYIKNGIAVFEIKDISPGVYCCCILVDGNFLCENIIKVQRGITVDDMGI